MAAQRHARARVALWRRAATPRHAGSVAFCARRHAAHVIHAARCRRALRSGKAQEKELREDEDDDIELMRTEESVILQNDARAARRAQ